MKLFKKQANFVLPTTKKAQDLKSFVLPTNCKYAINKIRCFLDSFSCLY